MWKIKRTYSTLEETEDPNAKPNWFRQEHVIDETIVPGTKAQAGIVFVKMLDKTEEELREGKLPNNWATVTLEQEGKLYLEATINGDWTDEDMAFEEMSDRHNAVREAFDWLKESNPLDDYYAVLVENNGADDYDMYFSDIIIVNSRAKADAYFDRQVSEAENPTDKWARIPTDVSLFKAEEDSEGVISAGDYWRKEPIRKWSVWEKGR